MTRYFFEFHTNGMSLADDVGTELEDFAEMRREAMRALPAIAADRAADHGDAQAYSVVVRDETRAPVFAISMCIVCQPL